jgi:hypothetical protein
VRVFLERPWYSSGDGEELAVVLQGKDALSETPTSKVGIDPTITESEASPTVELVLSMFPGAKTETEVRLSQEPADVAIASYLPRYDDLRHLWVCDVGIDMQQLPWGDWPFVRLALARYQPESILGAHLSKVVVADWAQLAPDRVLTVTRVASGRLSSVLRGRGRVTPHANRVVFAFERATTGTPDPLEWLPADASVPDVPNTQTWQSATRPTRTENEQVWSAPDLPIPDPQGKPLRLTIRELEWRRGEGDVGRGVVRIVYADSVRLA